MNHGIGLLPRPRAHAVLRSVCAWVWSCPTSPMPLRMRANLLTMATGASSLLGPLCLPLLSAPCCAHSIAQTQHDMAHPSAAPCPGCWLFLTSPPTYPSDPHSSCPSYGQTFLVDALAVPGTFLLNTSNSCMNLGNRRVGVWPCLL